MSKRFLAVLLILVFTTSVLVYIYAGYQKNSQLKILSHTKLVPSPIPQAELSIQPNPLVTTAGQTTSLNIILKDNFLPDATRTVQLELGYNPSILYNVSMFPGDYFVNPEIILEKIDARNGRISYALKGKSLNKSASIAATVTFTAITYGLRNETDLTFLPKTLIKTADKAIKLKGETDAKIIINPSFFQYTPSASASPTPK